MAGPSSVHRVASLWREVGAGICQVLCRFVGLDSSCLFCSEAPDDYDGPCDDVVETAGMSAEDLLCNCSCDRL